MIDRPASHLIPFGIAWRQRLSLGRRTICRGYFSGVIILQHAAATLDGDGSYSHVEKVVTWSPFLREFCPSMSHSSHSLHDLAQRIDQRQAELEQLRREYEARQRQLEKLTQRKQQLQAQLQQVEAEIAGLGQGQASPTKPITAAKPTPMKTVPVPPNGPVAPLSLPKLLVEIVKEAKRPVTIKELASEVVRRHYRSSSTSLPKTVETRVSELVKKGLLRRAPNKAGVLPGRKSPSAKASSPAAADVSKPTTVDQAASKAAAGAAGELTLAAAVTKVLAASVKPLTSRELAEKVLALGYQSKSKDFINVLWTGIGKMDNVEHVKGQGYRLKKGKTSPPASKGHNSK